MSTEQGHGRGRGVVQSAFVAPLYIPQPEVGGYIRASALRWQAIAKDARISVD